MSDVPEWFWVDSEFDNFDEGERPEWPATKYVREDIAIFYRDQERAASDARVEAAKTQCCMCGKTGLSTVEGDGGTECQLTDGRWTCSSDCWKRAVEPDARVEAAVRAGLERGAVEAEKERRFTKEALINATSAEIVANLVSVTQTRTAMKNAEGIRAIAADPAEVKRIVEGL